MHEGGGGGIELAVQRRAAHAYLGRVAQSALKPNRKNSSDCCGLEWSAMEWGGFGGMVVWWSCGVMVWRSRRVVWYGAYVA